MNALRHTFLTLTLTCLVLSTPALAQTPVTAPQPQTEPPAAVSVDELTARIRAASARPQYRRGQIGLKIVSLNTGKVLLEENADKYFMPASNMKNFTVAAGLETLSPDYRFVTSVYASAPADSSGNVRGPLRIYGRGDVSISYTFNNNDYFRGIDLLADAIAAAGVKRVEGDLIADETYFRGSPIPTGWEWDDLQAYYGAEVSALPINDNVVRITVSPGPVGHPCLVRMAPANLVVRVANQCTTAVAGTRRTLRVHKLLDRNQIEISGDLPPGDSGFANFISVSRPAEMFVSLLKQRLEEKGVEVTGRTHAVNSADRVPAGIDAEIAKLESPTLGVIAGNIMKPSQNMYTETLLWTLGEHLRGSQSAAPANRNSAQLGIEAVKAVLKKAGIEDDAVLQADGSGLARHNLVTPDSVVRLYRYMARDSKHSQAWLDSLTIAGVDGTLRNRFGGTRAAANVRGKTGTINQVSALSGYLTTAGGEQLVFSALVNGVAQTPMRVGLIDEIVVMLADFNGKID